MHRAGTEKAIKLLVQQAESAMNVIECLSRDSDQRETLLRHVSALKKAMKVVAYETGITPATFHAPTYVNRSYLKIKPDELCKELGMPQEHQMMKLLSQIEFKKNYTTGEPKMPEKEPFCKPWNAGLQSEPNAVARYIRDLLGALAPISPHNIDGKLVHQAHEFKVTMIEQLRNEGWQIKAGLHGWIVKPRGDS